MLKKELYSTLEKLIMDTVEAHDNKCHTKSISINSDIFEVFGISSIVAIEIIVKVEDCLNIEFPDIDLSMKNLQTIKKLADYIETLKKIV
jgi:acyl carrier protein